jgi:FKBP-type peptidyl-prolyl cis-trans isomerase FkpA
MFHSTNFPMKKIFLSIFAVLSFVLSACGGGGGSTSTAPTQLQVTDSLVGTGTAAAAGNTITVHYTGWLYDETASQYRGKQFDSSVGKTPFSFKLGVGQVIAGWDQGVVGMKVGGKRTLIIPSALGYGSTGAGSAIPPNAALVFDVELLSVQ